MLGLRILREAVKDVSGFGFRVAEEEGSISSSACLYWCTSQISAIAQCGNVAQAKQI